MSGSVLEASVVKRQNDAFTLRAEFSLAAGETLAVMGPSGAGKSTLLETICGLVQLDEGKIQLAGHTVASSLQGLHIPPSKRDVVLLWQQPNLFPHLNVLDNVSFGMRARGYSRNQARTEADSWLVRVGLPGVGTRRPEQLSGGQQQRVALARALATCQLRLLRGPVSRSSRAGVGDIPSTVTS